MEAAGQFGITATLREIRYGYGLPARIVMMAWRSLNQTYVSVAGKRKAIAIVRTEREADKTEAQLCMEDMLDEIFGTENVQPEFKFHPTRKWRFDWAIPAYKIGVELDGAIWSNGRHNRCSGYQRDLEKLNAANSLGWHVFRFSTQDALEGKASSYLRVLVSAVLIARNRAI